MTETVISSATKTVVIGFERRFVMIGERINPTGRKLLAAEMAQGDYSRVVADALAQVEAGAQMLDVNAGIPLADEPRILAECVKLVQETVDCSALDRQFDRRGARGGARGLQGQAVGQFGHRRRGAPRARAAAGEEIRRGGDRHLQ